ncbi:MAG: hypothetical protein ACI8TQ_001255 [Planctomycetota bacterium]|jgi:hypothetical protein
MIRNLYRTAACALALTATATTASAHFEGDQIWIVDQLNSKLYFVNPANFNVNTSLTAADGLAGPASIGFSLHGDMVIGNFASNDVFSIEPDLTISTVLTTADGVSGPFGGNGIAISPGHGDIFLTNFSNSTVMMYDEDFLNGMVFADAADGLIAPGGLAFKANGDLLIADRGINRGKIYEADELGNVSLFYEPPANQRPISITIQKGGDIFILTTLGNIYRLIGGDPLNDVLLGTYGVNSLRGSIVFGNDQTTIYHVNQAESILRAIDSTTGLSHVAATLPAGGGGTAMVLFGSHYAPGTFIDFGEPLAGTGGIDPTLHGHGEPRIGDPFDLELVGFAGETLTYTFIGTGMDESVILSGEFHIDLTGFYKVFPRITDGAAGVAGAGGFELNLGLPNDPSLVYVSIFAQAVGIDAGAVEGLSFTQCVEIYIGDSE